MTTQTSDTGATIPTKKYTRRSEAQWRTLIAHFEQSDLSLEAYCQHHKITTSGFYSWRKRFQGESRQNDTKETLIDITPPNLSSSTIDRHTNSAWQVELELGQGCVLRIQTA